MLKHKKPSAVVVIKSGPLGALAFQDDRFVRIRAPKVKVVDTTGAGDVFNAGYLFARSQGLGLKESVQAGVRIASHVIATSPRSYDPPRWRGASRLSRRQRRGLPCNTARICRALR
jgi:sugar/nucleoside kinase (ribokinase family)